MRILPPLRGVVTMGANPGLSPGANFGQALRANSGNDFVGELISQETSVVSLKDVESFCRPCGTLSWSLRGSRG